MANEKKVDTELLLSMSLDDIIAANAKKAGGKPAGKPKQQAVGGDAGSTRSSWLSEPAPCRREPATALSVERMSSPRAPATRRACLPRSCDLGPSPTHNAPSPLQPAKAGVKKVAGAGGKVGRRASMPQSPVPPAPGWGCCGAPRACSLLLRSCSC